MQRSYPNQPSLWNLQIDQIPTVSPALPVVDVLRLMGQAGASSRSDHSNSAPGCVVVTQDQQPIGILTERDAVRFVASGSAIANLPVSEVMTQPVITISQESSLNMFTALRVLQQNNIRHLPVVNQQGQLQGVLSTHSLQKSLRPSDLLHLRQVHEAMSQDVIVAKPQDSVMHIAQLMATHELSCVAITESYNVGDADLLQVPIGIITERDILNLQDHVTQLEDISAAEMMSNPVILIPAHADLWEAHQTMERRHIRRLLVTGDRSELVGIVTQSDLLRMLDPEQLYATLQAVQQAVDEYTVELQATNEKLQAEIHRRQEAERSLAVREAQYRTIVEQQVDLVCQFLPDGCLTFVNEAYANYLGQSSQDLIGKDYKHYIPAEYQGALRTHLERLTPDHSVDEIEYPIQRSNGEKRWIHWSDRALFDAQGQVTGILAVGRDVSDRKSAEIALQRSQDSLRHLLNASPVAIYTCEPRDDYGNTFVSSNVTSIMGYPPQSFLQDARFWIDHIHPDDLHTLFEQWSIQSEQSYYVHEYRFLHGDGTYHWMYDCVNLIRDAEGHPLQFVGSWMDISDRKQIEANLQDSETRFRQLAENIPCVFWLFSPNDDQLLYISPAYEAIWGRSPNFNLIDEWLDTVHPDDLPSVRTIWEQVLAGETTSTEYRILRPDGDIRWVWARTFPIFDEQNNLHRIAGLAEDITLRKQVESSLKESESRYRTVISALSEGIVLQQADGQIIACNESAEQILGLTSDQMKGLTSLDPRWQAIHEDGSPFPGEHHPSMVTLRTGKPQAKVIMGICKPDQTLAWISINTHPLFNPQDATPYAVVVSFIDITEQRIAKQTVQDSEQRYRMLTEVIPQLIWVTDGTGETMVDCNQRWLDYTGQTPEDARVLSWLEALHPDDRDEAIAIRNNAIATQSIYEAEYRLQRAEDGDYIWHLARAVPILDDQGNISRWFGTFTDISDRKQMENKLQEQELQLRLITDSLPALIAYLDADQRYQFVNQHYAEFVQQPKEALIGNYIWDVLPHNQYQTIQPQMEEVLQGHSVQFETTFKEPSGRERNMQASYIPHFSNQGRIQGVYVLVQDITERKQTELALLANEERFRTIADFTHDWEYWADPLGNFLYVSPACQRITGYAPSEFLQDPQVLHQIIYPSDRPLFAQHLDQQLAQQKAAIDFRIVTHAGETRWINQVSQPVYRSDGEWLGTRASNRDISDRKYAEEQLWKQARREHLIGEIAQHIRQSLNLDEILHTAVTEVRNLLQVDRVIIHRFEQGLAGIVIEESCSPMYPAMLGWVINDPWISAKRYVKLYQQGRVLAVEDIYTQDITTAQQEFLEFFQIRAKLIVPLLHSNELWGLLIVHHCETPRQWHSGEVRLLQNLATQTSIAIQQAELHQELSLANQKLQRLAFLDGLTQVANRRRFDQYLDQEWRRLTRERSPLSLIIGDIDFFKRYNDTYGHQAGDDCLRQIAGTLNKAVKRPADLVARYGGEEFVIVLPQTNNEGGTHVAKAIQKAVRKLKLDHCESSVSPYITLSLGLATCIPSADSFPEALIAKADEALYEAKAQGRDRLVIAT